MRGAATPAVSPERAVLWLEDWNAIGGGITLGKDGTVSAWRVPPAGVTTTAEQIVANEAEAEILTDLLLEPGLLDGVRLIVQLRALAAYNKALPAITRRPKS